MCARDGVKTSEWRDRKNTHFSDNKLMAIVNWGENFTEWSWYFLEWFSNISLTLQDEMIRHMEMIKTNKKLVVTVNFVDKVRFQHVSSLKITNFLSKTEGVGYQITTTH